MLQIADYFSECITFAVNGYDIVYKQPSAAQSVVGFVRFIRTYKRIIAIYSAVIL